MLPYYFFLGFESYSIHLVESDLKQKNCRNGLQHQQKERTKKTLGLLIWLIQLSLQHNDLNYQFFDNFD
nr:hypothetical protein BCU43_24975 [Vibrio lentus]